MFFLVLAFCLSFLDEICDGLVLLECLCPDPVYFFSFPLVVELEPFLLVLQDLEVDRLLLHPEVELLGHVAHLFHLCLHPLFLLLVVDQTAFHPTTF